MLGPAFERSIGQSDADWEERFRVLENFWSSVLFASRRYHGNPLAVHLAIPDLVPAMFERWLTVLHLTCDKVFQARVAADVADRAERIVRSLNAAIAGRRRWS